MITSKNRRRFVPGLDVLASRIAPSGVIGGSPMEPSITSWEECTLPENVSPLDPTYSTLELPEGTDIEVPDDLASLIIRQHDYTSVS